jgi:hypothetical protein
MELTEEIGNVLGTAPDEGASSEPASDSPIEELQTVDQTPTLEETPPPSDAPLKEDAPVEPAPEVPVEDVKDTEISTLRSTIEELRRTIETVASQAASAQSAPIVTSPDPTVISFIEKEEELDDILKSVDNFNKFMTMVVTRTQELVLENAIPKMSQVADATVGQKMAVAEFYRSNQDLVGNRAYVGMVANEIAATHPEWTLDKIIEGLGTEVRTRLKLIAGTNGDGVGTIAPLNSAPAFAPPGGGRPSGAPPTLGKMEKEIADLLDGI